MDQISDMTAMQECIDECMNCYSLCLQTAMNDCLTEGARHIEPEHFRLLMSCSGMCRTAAEFMLSSSPLRQQLCGVCADVCEACAASCERIGGMDDCVQACRACAESCRAMSATESKEEDLSPTRSAQLRDGDATPVRPS